MQELRAGHHVWNVSAALDRQQHRQAPVRSSRLRSAVRSRRRTGRAYYVMHKHMGEPTLIDTGWMADGLCSGIDDDARDFRERSFQGEESVAKQLCADCPVRLDCLDYALNGVNVWDVWGGLTAHELRRTLGIDAKGQLFEHGRAPQCPNCRGRSSWLQINSRVDVSCRKCNYAWQAESSVLALQHHNAV